jgi:hypothetical protein
MMNVLVERKMENPGQNVVETAQSVNAVLGRKKSGHVSG